MGRSAAGQSAYYQKRALCGFEDGGITIGAFVRRYQFQIVYLDRLELRTNGAALDQLNALGAEGWHVVHIKETPMRERDLAIFLEREIT